VAKGPKSLAPTPAATTHPPCATSDPRQVRQDDPRHDLGHTHHAQALRLEGLRHRHGHHGRVHAVPGHRHREGKGAGRHVPSLHPPACWSAACFSPAQRFNASAPPPAPPAPPKPPPRTSPVHVCVCAWGCAWGPERAGGAEGTQVTGSPGSPGAHLLTSYALLQTTDRAPVRLGGWHVRRAPHAGLPRL